MFSIQMYSNVKFKKKEDNTRLEREKIQLQEIFKDQIEDLDTNLKKVDDNNKQWK